MSAPVPPVSPPAPAATQTTAPPAVRGTVQNTPDVASLVQGQSLNAEVVSSSSGQLVLVTSLGRIAVQTTANLPPGTSVLLQVQSVGETLQVTLQLQNPSVPAQGANVPGARAPGSTPAAAPEQLVAPVTTRLTEGSIVQAVVTRAAPPPAPGVTANPQAPASAPAGAGPSTAAATATAVPTQAPQAAAPALIGGTNLTLRLLAVAPPEGELPPSFSLTAPAGGPLLVASVSGFQPGGAPVASGAAGDLVLSNAPPLPLGSRLLLEVLALQPPDVAEPAAPFSTPDGRWEALNEALATLQRVDPALAHQVAQMIVPTPGPRMAGTMLFFLSAVFSGDVRRFFGGDAMRQLGRAPGALVDRLSSDIGQLQRTATDSTGQDWRLILIPMQTDEGLEQLRFMLRRDEDDGKSGDGDTGTRFMIEVNMSRLGPFQFDGLTRNKHVDLMVRTHQELPKAMREDIRSIFGNTITALGFTGTIAFRAVPKFEISPIEQAPDGHKDLVV
jgi:hypothetical protein